MGLKKGKCDCWRKIGECLAEIDPEKCSARDTDGFCLSILADCDPGAE